MMEPSHQSISTVSKSAATGCCKHFVFAAERAVDVNARVAAIKEYMERRGLLHEKYPNRTKVEHLLEETKLCSIFWGLHSHLVDDLLLSILYSGATEHILIGRMTRAAVWVELSFGIQKLMGKTPTTQDQMNKILTERGLVLFLWRRVSCSCLAEKKQVAKRSSKTILCYSCYKESTLDQTARCVRCKVASYCSQECLEADWDHHKKFCDALENV